jgi:RNA polymerase sigma factor (sigma-70 family)
MNEDRDLVGDVLAQRRGAFERLVERHQRLAWHIVHRMVQHPEDTRELCQEVFLRVHQRLAQFRFESSLSTWIGRIAFSVATRHLQRRRLPMVNESAHDDGDDAPISRIGDGFDLESAFADAELVSAMTSAMEALPPLQRTLLTLYHLDELGIAEIARITDMPEGTVKNYLFRARARLRKQLEAMIGEHA